MMNLDRFFEVQFDDGKIGRQSLRKFAQDHLHRLKGQNINGRFDRMIQDTQRAYDNFLTALNLFDSSASNRQGDTLEMNNLLTEFKARISRTEGLIRHVYDAGTPQYEKFFPHGMSEYHGATLANVETLMNRFVKTLAKFSAKLGIEEQTAFTDLQKAFVDARETQLSQKGLVSASSSSADIERSELELQLTKNLFRLAYRYVGKLNAASIFFDQSIIRSGTATDTNTNSEAVDMNALPPISAAV